MLENLKLDDRTYQEIREEAIANIIKHCPEWTNHNSSDPGITLVELFSSMTEMLMYRLNQVPEKNYVAFLDLLGVNQRLATPAYSRVAFSLSEGFELDLDKKTSIYLKSGSLITDEPTTEKEPTVFETENELYLSNVKLINLYSKRYNKEKDRDEILDFSNEVKEGEGFEPFNIEEKLINQVEIFFYGDDFEILKSDSKTSLVFRLPTTLRKYDIKSSYFNTLVWEYFNGEEWCGLKVIPNYNLLLDDKDADIMTVTFEGNNTALQKSQIEVLLEEEHFFIKGIFKDLPNWLPEFSVYEVSLISSSNQNGIMADACFYNYEQLDLNSDFYPFGRRPKVDNPLEDEFFIVKCDDAFANRGTTVSLEFIHSLKSEYRHPAGSGDLKIVWEYPIGPSKWVQLQADDHTDDFTMNGNITFVVPPDLVKINLNGEEGYWVRAKIHSGNYGMDESSEYDQESGKLITKESTLRPPLMNNFTVHYALERKDLDSCFVLNNYRYQKIIFEKNKAVELFRNEYEHEEALIFGFDSYLSDERLDLYFDIDGHIEDSRNLNQNQRIISWEIYQNGSWQRLKVDDTTDGLTKSGDVKISLPVIENLEMLMVNIQEMKRLWIKARVSLNSLKKFPKVNRILLNCVNAVQKETHSDEYIAHSVGLPNMKFTLNHKNLIAPPIIFVGEDEFKAVDRFIDHSKDERVFRFNGITGDIEFGDGVNGAVPELGETIIATEYSTTVGGKGNLIKDKLKVFRESINYIDSVTNITNGAGGKDGDNLHDLKKYAPSVLKTMERAVTLDDYKLLAQNYSQFIQKAVCIGKESEVIVIILTKDILEAGGFVNKKLLEDLEEYLKLRSLITVKPTIITATLKRVKVHIKLKYTVEKYSFAINVLREEILKESKEYTNPFTGYYKQGYPLGRSLTKGDFNNIISLVDSAFYLSEIGFKLPNEEELENKISVDFDELVFIEDIIIEEISYDI